MHLDSLKILAVVPYPLFPAVSGGQKHMVQLHESLNRQITFAACVTKNTQCQLATYKVFDDLPASFTRYINPFLFFRIQKRLQQEKSTHLLFEHPYYAWMILLFAIFSRVKIIVHSHNIESMRFKSLRKWWWPILWCYEWLAYKCADQVWFITQSDKNYAVKVKAVSDQHSVVVPHGTELSDLPLSETRQQAKQFLIDRYGMSKNDKIILFNGALGYAPNLEALRHILDDINPLLQQIPISYKIMICGSGLPADMDGLKAYAEKNIIFAGFVDSISPFLLGADLFLNPMCSGGGMQTKLIEALGYGLSCVSSVTGSTGIEQAYTDGRLRIVPDQNWQEYCNAILELPATLLQTEKQMFYQYYSWNQIAKRTLNFLIH